MKISKKEDFGLIFMSILAKDYSRKYIPLSFAARKSGLSLLFLKHIVLFLVPNYLNPFFGEAVLTYIFIQNPVIMLGC